MSFLLVGWTVYGVSMFVGYVWVLAMMRLPFRNGFKEGVWDVLQCIRSVAKITGLFFAKVREEE